MARAISDEELQLKRRARRRLIGAIVLVTAIILVLPMVLDSEPKPIGQAVSVQIPSPDSGVFTSKVVPLPGTPVSQPPLKALDVKPVSPANIAGTPSAAPAASQEAPPMAEPEPKKPASTAPAKPRAPIAAKKPRPAAKATSGQFVVQVIALADAERAKQMQSQIAAAGVKSYTEVVKTRKGDVTRVRAGPFATRAAAEKAREQLKALGMSGNITAK